MGVTIHSGDREFRIPDHYPLKAAGWRVDENGVKYIRIKGVRWWTNLDHGRRHEKIPLMTMEDNLRFSKHKEIKGKATYDRYDNYDAIEVPFTDAIPSNYEGAMGVPITFLDRYNPDQFEILGITDRDNNSGVKTKEYTAADVPNYGDLNRRGVVRVGNKYKPIYARLIIRHRRAAKPAKGR
jgi:hypothetical protein